MRPGKQFEDETGTALKHLGAYRLNQNEEHGACDWVAFHRGMGLVIYGAAALASVANQLDNLLVQKYIFPISEKPVDNIADIGYIQLVGTNDANKETRTIR